MFRVNDTMEAQPCNTGVRRPNRDDHGDTGFFKGATPNLTDDYDFFSQSGSLNGSSIRGNGPLSKYLDDV